MELPGFQVITTFLARLNQTLTNLNGFRSTFTEDGQDRAQINDLETLRRMLDEGPIIAADDYLGTIVGRVVPLIDGENPTLVHGIEDVYTLRDCLYRALALNLFNEIGENALFTEIKTQIHAIARIIGGTLAAINSACDISRRIHEVLQTDEPHLAQLGHLRNSLNTIAVSFIARVSLLLTTMPRQVMLQASNAERHRLRVDMPSRTKISAKLQTLSPLIGFGNEGPSIGIYLVNHHQAHRIDEGGRVGAIEAAAQISAAGQEAGNIVNRFCITRRMSLLDGEYGVEVDQVQISSPPRRYNGVNVTEQRFYFVVIANLQYNGKILTAWTLSAPVILRTHINQASDSLITINRINYFSDVYRFPFTARPVATWMEVEGMLEYYLVATAQVQTSEAQNMFLRNKLATSVEFWRRGNIVQPAPGNPLDMDHIPLDAFFGMNMMNSNFSFWTWIYEWGELLQKHRGYFGNLVRAGFIESFIGREEAPALLQNQEGSFVIRCSESFLGSLPIIFAHTGANNQHFIGSHFIQLKSDARACLTFLGNIHDLCVSHGGVIRGPAFLNVVSRTLPQGTDKAVAFPRMPEEIPVNPYDTVGRVIILNRN